MKKAPILICLYAYFPFENANTNVMMPLIEELNKKYEVHILTENRDGNAAEYEIADNNIIIHRYSKNTGIKFIAKVLGDIDRKKKRIWYKSYAVKILSPIGKGLQRIIKKNEYIEMERLTEEFNFSFVITTCESFDSHRNMLALKKNTGIDIPWIAYFMDPFSYYIENIVSQGDLLQTEKEVYRVADLILVTEEIYKENQNNVFSEFLYKTVAFKFGNFKCSRAPLINDIFEPSKINCVYAGSLLNKKIRDPQYFYQIINRMDDGFHFHIICNQVSKQNEQLFQSIVKNKKNVSWHHNLSLNECFGIMSHADVLINLGNKSINQTPSKVFDYIGTGRPIVNFYSLKEDTSKTYLEAYPCKLNIFESDSMLEENTKEFIKFTKSCAGKVVPTEIIMQQYRNYDSEAVTHNTMEKIDAFLCERKK